MTTVTSAGSRRLAALMARPFARADLINERLDGVSFFHEQERLTEDLRSQLGEVPDLERALARVTARRASPRDLAALSRALHGPMPLPPNWHDLRCRPWSVRHWHAGAGPAGTGL